VLIVRYKTLIKSVLAELEFVESISSKRIGNFQSAKIIIDSTSLMSYELEELSRKMEEIEFDLNSISYTNESVVKTENFQHPKLILHYTKDL